MTGRRLAVEHGSGRRRRMFTGAPARILLTAALVALSLTAGPVAYSYWAGSGGGTGNGRAATTVPLTLSRGEAMTATLYPGGAALVVVTATNANLSPIYIGSLALQSSQGTDGFGIDSAHAAAGCASASFTFTRQTTGWTVPAATTNGSGTLPITVPGLNMAASASNACQGAEVIVFLKADS
ncbi:hypothetical protein E3T55_13645 [Cryobacterium frigoriphilum]|uniref:Uncharacterized protein n=1 Tax=Cryobacterium frigoriphilum TaxID=1259150 RepID=A0A4R8ZX43_9MICO|nr:hypothetical protein [Cryobacterium frigoriphilum]TFD48316.1 hypothetical protein E3T55_13645 [Cryobacterium frigoriphilum]